MPDPDDQVRVADPARAATPQTDGRPVVPPSGGQPESVLRGLRDVDDALRDIGDLPVADQVAVFTDLHQQLTAALAVTAAAAGPVAEPPQHRPGAPGQGGR